MGEPFRNGQPSSPVGQVALILAVALPLLRRLPHRLPLPACSPELNPAEQILRVLRSKLANRIFGRRVGGSDRRPPPALLKPAGLL